jgi:methylated-DNA-[protein]-cysteine S-methyltransferase
MPRKIAYVQYYRSPCGEMLLASIDGRLCLCDWNEKNCAERNKRRIVRLLHADFQVQPSKVLLQTKQQLDEYFARERRHFDIPLLPAGTAFQQSVWEALLEIPYGETRTYKDIALRVGNPKGIRAVAQAIGANGIGIIIPCHRVIGSNHTLTGFAGGLEAKKTLLELENE